MSHHIADNDAELIIAAISIPEKIKIPQFFCIFLRVCEGSVQREAFAVRQTPGRQKFGIFLKYEAFAAADLYPEQPGDVRMLRLPFENALVERHLDCVNTTIAGPAR